MGIAIDFPWDDLGTLIKELKDKGAPDIADQVGIWVAEHVDFSLVIPGPVGKAIEAIDDPLARMGLLGRLVTLVAKLHPFRKRATVQVPPGN